MERKTSKMYHFWRVTHPDPATHAAKASFTAILHHFLNHPRSQAAKRTRRRKVNELAFFSSAKGVTLRESPLSLAKITKTCSSQTMSAAGDLSAAAQYLPDVERRRCRSILEAGFLSAPKIRWLCTRRCSFRREKRVASEELLLVIAP